MAQAVAEHPGQMHIPSYGAELVPALDFDRQSINGSARLALTSLIDRLEPGLRFGREPSFRDYQHAQTDYIEEGLYVPVAPARRQGRNVEHVIFPKTSSQSGPDVGAEPFRQQLGVAFQPVEFKAVARNARDLGRHAVVRTRDARWGASDPQETTAAAKRSAGHALVGKIASMESLSRQLAEDSEVLRHLIRHLVDPAKVRVRARRLDAERMFAIEKIHDTIEVAGIYHGDDGKQLAGQHRVVKKHTYSGNYSHAERTEHLVRYFQMIGQHNKAKLYKLAVDRHLSQIELDTQYQQYLDAEEARQRDQAQAAA